MTERRFLVKPGDLASGEGGAVALTGPEHHHLSRVLRLGPGDEVSLFDGEGVGHCGRIETIGRDSAVIRLGSRDDRLVEPAFRLTLLQAIPQQDRMEVVVQKSTEIGVFRIVPMMARRSLPRPSKGGDWRRLERWRRVAREAARQSGRLRVPAVEDPVDWDGVEAIGARGHLVVLDAAPSGGGLVAAALPDLPPGEGEGALLVGPEGGWEANERERAARLGFRPVWLGPRVMRTETAGIVGAALMLFQAGELGRRGA